MSVQILDKSNSKAPRVMLIDENYCLNDSFDIIQQNFNVLLDSLNSLSNNNVYAQAVLNRYNKNKAKYQQFLTYVSQFSSNWIEATQVYTRNINIWNNIYTPLEVVFPAIVNIGAWGTYNNGNITENSTISQAAVNSMQIWINSKYPVEIYGIYQKLNLRFYLEDVVQDVLNFEAQYLENCDPGGGGTVCCDGCDFKASYGNKGCNHSIVNGRGQCANMYDWCPGRDKVQGFSNTHWGSERNDQVKVPKGFINSKNCADGSCVGWGYGYDTTNWKGQLLKLNGSLTGSDNRLIGAQIINFIIDSTTNKWIRTI